MNGDRIGYFGPYTADQNVSSGRAFACYGVKILSGAIAGTVNLRNGTTATDTSIIVLEGTANKQEMLPIVPGKGVVFPSGLFADMDANVTNYVVFGEFVGG